MRVNATLLDPNILRKRRIRVYREIVIVMNDESVQQSSEWHFKNKPKLKKKQNWLKA